MRWTTTAPTAVSDSRHGLLYLHGSALLFGGTALFARLIPLPALDITTWRSLVACVGLFLLLNLIGTPLRLRSGRDLATAVILGMLLGLHWVTYFAGMQLAGVTIGLLAFFSYPVMTVVLEPLLDKRLPALTDLLLGLVVMAGVMLLVPRFDSAEPALAGVLLGTLSALLFTLRNLLQRRRFAHYNGATAVAWQTGVVFLMLLPFTPAPTTAVDGHSLGLLLLLGLCFTALPHAMVAESLRRLSASTVGLVSCLQPLYAAILAAWLLAERPGWRTLLGGALVVGAALAETWRAHHRRQQSASGR